LTPKVITAVLVGVHVVLLVDNIFFSVEFVNPVAEDVVRAGEFGNPVAIEETGLVLIESELTVTVTVEAVEVLEGFIDGVGAPEALHLVEPVVGALEFFFESVVSSAEVSRVGKVTVATGGAVLSGSHSLFSSVGAIGAVGSVHGRGSLLGASHRASTHRALAHTTLLDLEGRGGGDKGN